MEFTGERYIPGIPGNIKLEHLHRYYLACQLAQGKEVLDIACGEGYGSALLAQNATHVIGVDISAEAIFSATECYKMTNLEYKQGSCSDIPLRDRSIDLAVSFETIEHVVHHDQMMAEVKRVMRPDGILLISTPDRKNYSLIPGNDNPFHVKELFFEEFIDLLKKYYKNQQLFGQRILFGSHIVSSQSQVHTITYHEEQNGFIIHDGIVAPRYWLATASDGRLPELPSSIYEQPIDESEQVQLLKNEISSMKNIINEQKDNIKELENEVVGYVMSRSWQWTRIFRYLSKIGNTLLHKS